MVGFDLPVVSHDMMLRFMDVDLSSAAGPSAKIPSRVGNSPGRELIFGGSAKDMQNAILPNGETAQQSANDAKWEAY